MLGICPRSYGFKRFVLKAGRIFTLVMSCTLFQIASAFGQGSISKFIPNVPDENQPPASGKSNWCTPTSAFNILEYWDNVLCNSGANGVLDNWPSNVANDSIGWFMDTNNQGSPSRFNSGSLGTINRDIKPGITEFVRWDGANLFGSPNAPSASKNGYDWFVQTVYTTGFDFNAAEIDSGRPTIITFKHWNLIFVGTDTIPATGTIVDVYNWGQAGATPTDPQAPEETWNLQDGEDGIGHAGTGVGYWRNSSPGGLPGDWVIVHDNWSSTVRPDMAVPWQNWTSVTEVKVLPFIADVPFTLAPTIDGNISSGEYANADSVQFIQSGDTAKVYYKVDGTDFYAAFNITDISASSSARIYFDTTHGKDMIPQTDDYRFTHAINNVATEDQGTGSGWTTNTASGWNSAINIAANSWQAEFRISYTKLGLIPGAADTLGISFWDAATANGDYRWPTGAEDTVPCTWGELVSSDLYVPVELTSFEARVSESYQIILFWSTRTESNNYGFEIQRKTTNLEFKKIDFVNGHGTTSEPQNYSYVDQNLSPGEYFYRLKQIDSDGSFEYSKEIEVELPAPDNYVLHHNYPNPFNPSTNIVFELPEASHVGMQIYNVRGQMIKTLVDRDYSAGKHKVSWDGLTDMKTVAGSGLYFYKIKANNFVKTQKMLLIQ